MNMYLLPPSPATSLPLHRNAHAIQHCIRHKDIARLAQLDYHQGPYGLTTLNECTLLTCGYSTDSHHGLAKVMICYNNIITIHNTVILSWSNVKYHTSEPQLNRIVANELSIFPHLLSTSAEDVVDFYNRLHEMSAP